MLRQTILCNAALSAPTARACPDGTRNLLDFNDLTVDKQGRVLAAVADGCVTADCIRGVDRNSDGRLDSNDNDGTDKATIIRQTGGKRLFAAFDPPENAKPEPPLLWRREMAMQSILRGPYLTRAARRSPVIGLYRGVEGGAESSARQFRRRMSILTR